MYAGPVFGLALLHEGGLDELLIAGVIIYLLVMLVLAGRKAGQLRRDTKTPLSNEKKDRESQD